MLGKGAQLPLLVPTTAVSTSTYNGVFCRVYSPGYPGPGHFSRTRVYTRVPQDYALRITFLAFHTALDGDVKTVMCQ